MCTLVGTLVGVLVVVLLDVPPLVGGVVKPPTVVASAKPAVARARATANRTPRATTLPRAPLSLMSVELVAFIVPAGAVGSGRASGRRRLSGASVVRVGRL